MSISMIVTALVTDGINQLPRPSDPDHHFVCMTASGHVHGPPYLLILSFNPLAVNRASHLADVGLCFYLQNTTKGMIYKVYLAVYTVSNWFLESTKNM